MSQAEATDSTTESNHRKLVDPFDCEDDFSEIVCGIAALRTVWDAVANGACHTDEQISQSLHFITSHMRGAAERLAKTLGLD